MTNGNDQYMQPPSTPAPAPKETTSVNTSGIGGLLRSTFAFYGKQWKTLTMIYLLPLIILMVVNAIALAVGLASLIAGFAFTATGAVSTTTLITGGVIGMLVFLILYVFVTALIGSWASAALLIAIKEHGQSMTMGQALSKAKPYVLPVLLVNLLVGAIALGGSYIFVVPGIFFAFALSLSWVIAITENARGFEALNRSMAYIKGRWWYVFGGYVVMALLFVAATMVLSPFGKSGSTVNTVLNGILNLIWTPLLTIFSYFLYQNLKADRATTPETATKSSAVLIIFAIIGVIGFFALPMIILATFR